MPDGPADPPAKAVPIDPSVVGDISAKTEANPPGTVFWLGPGTHRLSKDEFAQVAPKSGNTYIGAPGAILDGAGRNRYAFTGKASNVTLQNLTIRGFNAPVNEGVVNHDSGAWLGDRKQHAGGQSRCRDDGGPRPSSTGELPEGQRSVRTERLLRGLSPICCC